MSAVVAMSLHAVPEMPLIAPGDDLAAIIGARLRDSGIGLQDGDIVVLAQKIVSKAEDRYIDLTSVTPSQAARDLAAKTGKDPRHVEVVLSEADEIVKTGPHVIVVAHRLGFVMANAGVDESNIDHGGGARVLLLPKDPDQSAAGLRQELEAMFGVSCGVIINDSFGRPWRNGVVGVALGAAGVPSLIDRVGAADLFGRELKVTEIATADELASAASLLMGQANEGRPVIVIRNYRSAAPQRPASALLRSRERDMFR
ncbi:MULTISPECIES: coenzyme F420-0:L-glutamate ligase [unclassified Mesorhizobium]|uniref:coenzyme F420-0:L-glutamate ligase n=1 Tax=unclassified Mesorhizobium TaxID=325217 RepID=UPI00112694E3|nr:MULTISPECIES: coenzyme F420-0:L-glutamate ligase [unclassified Mesorhizobium]MBZ9810979.1 coenzyme F420-0:L-glutamate ligase [Mesorhizobium sp. ESP-6-2]TPM27761.1 coenzyme F420-0:L-glutamate ligase [Mesorhizobium sp. B2-2-2]